MLKSMFLDGINTREPFPTWPWISLIWPLPSPSAALLWIIWGSTLHPSAFHNDLSSEILWSIWIPEDSEPRTIWQEYGEIMVDRLACHACEPEGRSFTSQNRQSDFTSGLFSKALRLSLQIWGGDSNPQPQRCEVILVPDESPCGSAAALIAGLLDGWVMWHGTRIRSTGLVLDKKCRRV